MADTAHDALLMQAGERVNLGLDQNAVRANLLKFVGEEQKKRVVERNEARSDIEKVELAPLDEEEQEIAWLQIKEMHPLADTPYAEAFPTLCCCLAPCSSRGEVSDKAKMRSEIEEINDRLNKIISNAGGGKYEGTSFRKDLSNKFGIPYTKKDGSESKKKEKKQSDEDKNSPFAEYGFGIKAWIGTLRFLFGLYLVMSLFAYAMMTMYSDFDGLETPESFGLASVTKYSLGNIGFVDSLCFFQYATMKKPLQLKCNKGTLSPIHYMGSMSSQTSDFLPYSEEFNVAADTVRVGHDFCGNSTLLGEENDCSQWVNWDDFTTDYESTCLGEKTCDVDLTNYIKWGIEGDTQVNGLKPAGAPDTCYDKFTQIYIQVQCEATGDDLKIAKQTICMVIFVGLLICLKFFFAVDYLQKIQVYQYKKWDVDTCTPADYSIKMHISDTMYENYLNGVKQGNYQHDLDDMIVSTLQSSVGQLDSVLEMSGGSNMSGGDGGKKKTEIKIASITFGYKNGELIRKMMQRGALIGAGNFHEVPNKDDELNQIIKDDADKLKQPVCAFITFTEQEAYERCEEYYFRYFADGSLNHKYEAFNFLEEDVYVEAAPEPSNIIWENLETTDIQRFGRKSCVSIVIVIFIFLTFLLYSSLKSKSGANKLMYPATTDCASFELQFTDDAGEVDWDLFMEYAEDDKNETKEFHGAGYYLCYCKLHSNPADIAKLDEPKDDVCYIYQQDKAIGMGLTNFVTALVTIMNIIIRTTNIKLIKAIGYDTVSKEVSMIMLAVFYSTFVNTGIILLMTNAELRYSILTFLPLHQQYPDFNENWYEEIGPALVKTMFIMAFYPYAEMTIFGGIKKLQQVLDKGCNCCDTYATKTTTPFKYITMYSGPEYMMHFKYSSIMTQIFISFAYGLFLPVLIPICMLGIMNMYIVEKWALLYYFRKPPMYDDVLQKQFLGLIKNAPIGMLLMGYWAVGNSQVFFGRVSYRTHNNNVGDPQHYLINSGNGLDQTHWLLILCFLIFLKRFIYDTIANCIKCCAQYCCAVQWEKDVLGEDVKEAIGNYWQSMTGDDQKIWYTTETYSKFRFGISSISQESFEQLRTADRRKAPKIDGKKAKFMEGDSRYDILANVTYQQAFQFNSVEQRNEYQDYVLSDMIMRALNLDDDKTIKSGEDANIFQDSFRTLVDQAMNTSATNKDKHPKSGANEGGQSDRFFKMKN